MNSVLGSFFILLALLMAAPALAQEPIGCDKFKWPVDRERAPLASPSQMACRLLTQIYPSRRRARQNPLIPMQDLFTYPQFDKLAPIGSPYRTARASTWCKMGMS